MPKKSVLKASSHSILLWACFTWFITSLFYSFQFFLRSSINPMANQLMKDFAITSSTLGFLSSGYYISYTLLQIPIGISLDIWGPKKALRLGTIVCVLGAAIFSLSHNFPLALLGRCLIGAGAAVTFIGSIRINTLWFSYKHLAFVIALLSAVGKIGSASANAFLPSFIRQCSSWHQAISYFCLLGLLLTILIWVFIKNGPEDRFSSLMTSSSEKVSWSSVKVQLYKVLKTPIVWGMGLYGYSLYLTLSVFSDTYSNNFFAALYGISSDEAGQLTALISLGSAFGASLIAYLSDFFERRRFFLRICSLLTFLIGAMIIFGPVLPLSFISFMLFMLGFFSGGQILIFIVASESLPHGLSGIATGVANSLLMAGGMLHNPLVGWLTGLFWDGHMSNGHPIYSIFNYKIAFSSIIFCYFIAFLISIFIKETHPNAA